MRCAKRSLGFLVWLVLLLAVQVAQAQQICYAYDLLGRLVAVVDPQGQTAIYDYDAVGNLLAIERQDATGPVAITFMTPSTAAAGVQVQILGIGFSADPSQNQVTINGVAAQVVAANNCMLTVDVPAGAPSGAGAVRVTTPSGAATALQPFTVKGGIVLVLALAEALRNQPIGFSATVTGVADQRVTWSVNGIGGGNATVGTISSAGLYTAPATIPNPPTVPIQVTSVPVPTVSGQALVTIVLAGNGFARTAVSVQFGPLPPAGEVDGASAPVNVQFGPLPSRVVNALPVSVANAPVISTVTPGSASTGTVNSLTLSGVNFTGAMTLVFLLNGVGDANISTTNLTVNPSGDHLSATVTIAAAAALGPRVVAVKTSAGSSTISNTGANVFTVTAP